MENNKIDLIKEQIKGGTYDWKYAVETCAEKIILLNDLFSDSELENVK